MAKKKSFVLRLNEKTHQAVEKWAADEFRSVNGQLEWIVTEALKSSGRWKGLKEKTEESEE
ncbi:MAG: Arc family DNA-binding protein [Cytophagales bacterium]|nr:Arc family DNA-binding protein [Cytophagales bacterium]